MVTFVCVMRTSKPLSEVQKLTRSEQLASSIQVLSEALKSLDETSLPDSFTLKLKIARCIEVLVEKLQRLHGADDSF